MHTLSGINWKFDVRALMFLIRLYTVETFETRSPPPPPTPLILSIHELCGWMAEDANLVRCLNAAVFLGGSSGAGIVLSTPVRVEQFYLHRES